MQRPGPLVHSPTLVVSLSKTWHLAAVKYRGPSTSLPIRGGLCFPRGRPEPPKGILRNHDSMAAEVLGWCLELSIRRGSTFYIGRPLFYTGGLVLGVGYVVRRRYHCR